MECTCQGFPLLQLFEENILYSAWSLGFYLSNLSSIELLYYLVGAVMPLPFYLSSEEGARGGIIFLQVPTKISFIRPGRADWCHLIHARQGITSQRAPSDMGVIPAHLSSNIGELKLCVKFM